MRAAFFFKGHPMQLETVHQDILANGMKVLVIPDHRAPVVTHMVWYNVGSADEELGKSGIAHFLEHLMFKGTHNNRQGLFGEVVASCGGQENAFTSNDYTAYYQRVAPEHLVTMMEFESDRMRHLALNPDDVATERNVVLEERKQRTDNDPSNKLYEMVTHKLWETHPYGIPIIGWENEIEALNREDAFDVYHKFYAPNNAILVVSGDITLKEVMVLAKKTYGTLARGTDIAPRARRVEPVRESHETVTLRDEKVMQPQLTRSYRVPSVRTSTTNESEAFDLLSYMLGGGASSRLYKSLVIEEELAVNAGCWYHGSSYDEGRLMIYATPREDVTLEALEDAIDRVIAAFTIEENELRRAKTRMVAESIYAQDKQVTLAQIYGAALTTGSNVDEVLNWPVKIKAVKPADITSVLPMLARKHAVSGHLLGLSS
jgi:zinc protease